VNSFFSDIRGGACESARTWASQALDGELSELEQAALEGHLADCADCARFVDSMSAATLALRAAPPSEPETAIWTPPVHTAPRHRGRRLALAAAAAAVAASVAVGAGIGTLTRHGASNTSATTAPGGFAATQQPYREQSLLALLPRLHQRPSRVVAV
jgi:predicted anti-sigma-YlaC factor YlaD